MVYICKRCKGFKKSKKSNFKKCAWITKEGHRGRGLKSALKKAGRLAELAAKLDLGKMLIKKGVDHLPGLYVKGTLKINSGAAHGLINSSAKKLSARFSINKNF